MVFGTRHVVGVEAFHGKKRGQSHGCSDQDFEKLGIAVDDDHSAKAGRGRPGQEAGRCDGSGYSSQDRRDQRHGCLLDPAREENQ